jgi:DMSO/TMAO reductase YedYZ molybdopterin-dependent catalytic subunit
MGTEGGEKVPRGRAALNGVLATGAGLGAGHLISLIAPGSSPIVAVATRAIDLTPGPVKDWAVRTFGTADKLVLVVGAVVVTLALGALVGLAARRSAPMGLIGGAALVTVAIVAAGTDSARGQFWWAPGLVALVVGGWALLRLTRTSSDAAAPDVDRRGRRDWFRLALGLGGVGVVGALLGQWPRSTGVAQSVTLPTQSLTPFPPGLESQVPGLSPFVTPASDFYRIDVALSPPSIDVSSWRLSIAGMVDHPFSIGWQDLLAMDAIERPVTLECVSNEVGQSLIGSARWLGVRTSELLSRAGVQSGADMVLSSSIDGFSVSTPLQALLDDRDALVAYEMNGAALLPEHGFPVRLLTPGLYGFVGATKWLTRMEVTTFAATRAYWTVLGWSDHGPIKPSSRIEVPRAGVHVAAGTVKVGGTAWAHGVGVGKVQVRVDRGVWADATLGVEAGIEYWRQWLWNWDAAQGEHELQVRVIDSSGKAQDETVANAFPNGASGLHAIRVTVG